MPPRVSVVIPLYNPGRLFSTCLDSVRRQTYTDLEIVPVDDAGPEPLRERLEAIARVDARVKPVIRSKNGGLAVALNDGIRHSEGKYVLVFEQDCELADPQALDRAVEVAEGRPRAVLSGVPILPLDEMKTAEVAFALLRDHAAEQDGVDLEHAAYCEIKCDLFPREALEAAGYFDETFRFSGEDQVLSHRLHSAGWTILKSKALGFVLRSGDQVTVRANLRREFTYGRTQAAILLHSVRGALGSTKKFAQGRRRLHNRAFSALSGASILLFLLLLVVFGPRDLMVLLLLIPIIRAAGAGARARKLRRSRRNLWASTTACVTLAPVNDIVYLVAFGIGVLQYAFTRRA